MPPVVPTPSSSTGRRRLALGAVSIAAVVLAALVTPAAATPVTSPGGTPAEHTTPGAATAPQLVDRRASAVPAAPARPTFRTGAPRVPVDAVMGVVNGVKQPGSVRPFADAAETLAVTLDKPTIEDYWYWADGITITVRGATPGSRLILQDVGPDGAVVTTFDPVVADQTGTATAEVRGELVDQINFPTVGVHRITANSDNGLAGSATLDVIPLEGRDVKVSLSTTTLSQQQWYSQQIRITASGFAPNAALTMALFDPVHGGYSVGRALRADANGVFRYTLQAGTAMASPGLWEISFVSYATRGGMGTSGRGVFTITPSKTTTVGAVALTPKVTTATIGTTGVRYRLTGFRPFSVVDMSLRTSYGTDYDLGFLRMNGEGAMSDVIISSGSVPTGVYTLTIAEISTGNRSSGRFTVTNPDGSFSPNPALRLAQSSLTRLQAMDPAQGIVATGTGFLPRSIVHLEIRDALNRTMLLSRTSVVVAPADAQGRITFRVNPSAVPAVGSWTVSVFTYVTPQIITRAPLTVTS